MKRFVKAMAKTGAGNLGAMGLRIVATKIIAVLLGPQGIGLLSVLRQTLNVFGTIGSFGGQKAIVQGIASRNREQYASFLFSVLVVLLTGTILGSWLLLAFSPLLVEHIRTDAPIQWKSLMPWLIVPLVLNVILALLQGILNGIRAIGSLAITQVVQGLFLALAAYPVSLLVKSGYPVAMVVFISCGLLGGIIFAGITVLRLGLFDRADLARAEINAADIVGFLKFSGVIFCGNIFAAGVLLAIRLMAADVGGLSFAGYLDAAWAISNTYFILFASSITSTYFFPTLSSMSSEEERRRFVFKAVRVAAIFVVPIVILVICLKALVVSLLYSEAFLPSLEMLRWMLIGGFLQVSGGFLGNLLLVQRDLKVYLWRHLTVYSIFLLASFHVFYRFGSLEGIGIAYCLMCLANLLFLLAYCSYRYKANYFKAYSGGWMAGLGLIAAASFSNWSQVVTDWSLTLGWMGILAVYSLLVLRPGERSHLLALLKRRWIGMLRTRWNDKEQ